MAIQPLDQKLDKIAQSAADFEQGSEGTVLPSSDQDVQQVGQTTGEMALEPDFQVAGGLPSEILKRLTKVDIRAPKTPAVTPEAATSVVIEDTAKAAVASGVTDSPTTAKIAAKIETGKKPEITPQAFSSERKDVADLRATTDPALEKPPETAFNLPVMQTTEDIKTTVETMARMGGVETKTITFDDVRAAAENAGLGPKFIDDLTSNKLQVNPENTFKALNAMVASAKHLDGLAAKVSNGTATPTELAEMAQTIHFHNLLQQSVKGYQTNVAQSLAVMRMPRDGAVDISTILENLGSETDIVKFAQAYSNLKTPEGKAELIKGMAQGNPWEKLFTVYVNGILSRPGTQIKNALSNTIFLPYRMAERTTAAAAGTLRRGLGLGADESYELMEVPTMLASSGIAVKNGLELMAYAFNNGVPKGWTDPTKIARQQARMDLINFKDDGSLLSTGIKALNFVTTLPGRSLMSADEFFKGVNYTFELAAETTRVGIRAYDDALKAGSDIPGALKAQSDAIDQFTLNPPDYVTGLSEYGTFTQKLTGTIGEMQASMNPNSATGFALRTQMPFISTPVNVMSAVVERTLLAPFVKSFRSAIAAGGKEADMAMAKVGLSSAAMVGFSHMATNGIITGSGPGDKGTRQAMERQGWQPYSVVIDTSGMKEDTRDLFSQFPGSVRFGSGDYSGKVFLSYQGFEPVGALMAIGADFVDYARYEQDDSRLNAFAGGAVFGIANYMLEHPFLTGVGNIAALMGGNIPNSREHLVNIINGLAKIGTTTALKSVEPLSGFITSTKEKVDPLRRDYQADPNLGAGIKGVMDALNKWRSETPGLSQDLPPLLNIWSEPVQHEFSWSPLRMKAGKQNEVDQALIQLNANISMPARQLSMKDPDTGINSNTKLTAEEYNEMLRIANGPLELEKRVTAVVDLIKQDAGRNDLMRYQNMISSVFSDTFEDARKILANDSLYATDIQQRIRDKAQRLKEFGKGAR